MEEDEYFEGDVAYEWISNGGCAKCEDMETELYEEEPSPPHILCNCTVRRIIKSRDNNCRRESSVEITNWLSTHPTHLPEEERISFNIAFDYVVHCPDGTDIFGSGDIDIDYEDFFEWFDAEVDYEMILNEMLEVIEDTPENECEPCEPIPNV